MSYQKVICSNIRKLISSPSFTREELAEMLELNSSRIIYEWEKGNKLPNIENFYNLALIYDIKKKRIYFLNKYILFFEL